MQHAESKADDQQDQRDFQRDGHNADRRPQGPVRQIRHNHFVHHERSYEVRAMSLEQHSSGALGARSSTLAAILMATAAIWRGLVLIQMNHLRSRRLLQGKLLVAERKVHGELHHGQSDSVLLLRAPYLDTRGEEYRVVILVIAVVGISDQRAGFVIDELPVGQKIETAKNDFSREPAIAVLGADDGNDVVGLVVFAVLI